MLWKDPILFQRPHKSKNMCSYLEDLKAVDVEDTNVELLLVLLHGFIDALWHTHTHKLQYNVWHRIGCVLLTRTHINEVVEQSAVQRLGQGVPGETRLLRVQSHRDGLGLPAPLTVHDPTGQLAAEAILRDPQQEGWEGQNWQGGKSFCLSTLNQTTMTTTAALIANISMCMCNHPHWLMLNWGLAGAPLPEPHQEGTVGCLSDTPPWDSLCCQWGVASSRTQYRQQYSNTPLLAFLKDILNDGSYPIRAVITTSNPSQTRWHFLSECCYVCTVLYLRL